MPADDSSPVLRVVRGDATPEELAALIAVMVAMTGQAGSPESADRTRGRSAWSDRSRLLHASLHPAPSAWRRSALPR